MLIEKEWLSFSHRFDQRHGHGSSNDDDIERGPIFAQFLDCVYQLQSQNPTAFEFTDDLLILIADEAYACRYGTFLGNSDSERQAYRGTTLSLWTQLVRQAEHEPDTCPFLNPFYRPATPDAAIDGALLNLSTSTRHLAFWAHYHMRNTPAVPGRNEFVAAGARHLAVRVRQLEQALAKATANKS